MSQYHKIETLYERDLDTHKVKPGVFKNRTYTLLKEWEFTEKIDGTNVRLIWTPTVDDVPARLIFGGKSNSAQMQVDLVQWLIQNVTAEVMQTVFPDAPVVIYGEGYGAGIQKGGDYSPVKKFIMFDVLVDGKWWLNDENMRDVARKLQLDAVPHVGLMTLEQATEMVRQGFPSAIGTARAEGIVGRPAETLFDKKGARLIVKLKTKDF